MMKMRQQEGTASVAPALAGPGPPIADEALAEWLKFFAGHGGGEDV